MITRFGWFCTALVLVLPVAAPVAAQQEGLLVARATDAATARPLPSVQVSIAGQGTQQGGLTNQTGVYQARLSPGSYTVTFQLIGYAERTLEGVEVSAGTTTEVGVNLESTALALDEMVVTVGRQAEKKTDAPATVSVVSQQKIRERPVSTPVQHLFGQPGVDIIQQGIQSTNVVVRGFNNIFSGALHALTDNRIAGVPSLRVNLLHFVPSQDDDIARMEVVLGPGSALYGPNTANGVLHIITQSPLSEQGTTVAVAGGERDLFKGMARTAHVITDERGQPKLGFKISGQFFRGVDFRFNDPAELAARERSDIVEQGLRARGVPEEQIQLTLSRLGVRDFTFERWSGEARVDWKVDDASTLIFQTGFTGADGIELTGIGAGQTQDWLYSYYQARYSRDRLFAQVYLNKSDAGDSYLVRQGASLVDNSELWVAQVQHGFGFGGEMEDGKAREDLTYGVDAFLTRPKTEGRINGQHEDDDNIDEFGGYVQSQTALTERLDLIAAARVDKSSVLEDAVFSPRAALVYELTEGQSIRATFNRAFSTPTTLNMFLDINGGLAQGLEQLGFFTRAQGPSLDGIRFQNEDGSLRGIRSPLNPAELGGPGQLLPSDPTIFWQYAVGLLQAQGAIDAPTAGLLTSDAVLALMGDVGFNLLNPVDGSVTPLSQATIPDTPRLEESTTETFEVGYQGVIDNRVSISADVWYSRRENFTSPLIVRTPLVLLSGADLIERLTLAGLDQATINALVLGEGIPGFPGIAGTPLGVVSSDDVVTETADIVASYVNFGELDLWGWDLAFKAFLTDRWTLEGSASWVNDDFFVIRDDEEVEDFETVTDVREVLSLNAPDFKGSVTLGFRDPEVGFTAEGQLRFTSEFPVNSADFIGLGCLPGLQAGQGQIQSCVEEFTIFDLLLGYRIPDTGAELQLNIQNLFDEPYKNFVGVPEIGRLAMLQLKYNF